MVFQFHNPTHISSGLITLNTHVILQLVIQRTTYIAITANRIIGTSSHSTYRLTSGAAEGGVPEGGEGGAVVTACPHPLGQSPPFLSSLGKVISSPISILTSSYLISLRME